MNTAALSAFGIALDIAGATLLYFFAIGRPQEATYQVTEAYDDAKARRDKAIGFLGYLLLIDGFFLQFIASLENMRLQDIAK